MVEVPTTRQWDIIRLVQEGTGRSYYCFIDGRIRELRAVGGVERPNDSGRFIGRFTHGKNCY